jgi:hypothetical protein
MNPLFYLLPIKNYTVRAYYSIKEGIKNTSNWLMPSQHNRIRIVYSLTIVGVFLSQYQGLDQSRFFNLTKKGTQENTSITFIKPLMMLTFSVIAYATMYFSKRRSLLGENIQSCMPIWVKEWKRLGLISQEAIETCDPSVAIGLPRLVIFQALRHFPAKTIYQQFAKYWHGRSETDFKLLKVKLEKIDPNKFEKALMTGTDEAHLNDNEEKIYREFTSWTQIFFKQYKIIQEINQISFKSLEVDAFKKGINL